MKKSRSQKHTALCLLAWSCLEFTLSEVIESSANIPAEETSIRKFLRDAGNGTAPQANLSGCETMFWSHSPEEHLWLPAVKAFNFTSAILLPHAQCTSLLPPSYGFYYVEEGSGSSLGSVITYWCIEGYQLVGNGRLTCLLEGSISYWSHSPPHCEVIPKPLDKGFRVAVIASLISGVIIVAMSISFAVCCLRERMLRGNAQRSENCAEQLPRRRFKFGRSSSIKQEMENRRHFGKMKHNRRLHYRTSALYSCAHPGALAGYSNQGFQRSQENLKKWAPQSVCSEIHIFPQVVLKPGTIPSASMFVHLPQKPGDVPLNVKPCYSNLPKDLPSVYYRRCEGLSHLNKY